MAHGRSYHELVGAKMRPYVIHGTPWHHWIGGARALHYLCNTINLIGGEAYIATDEVSGYLDTPVITRSEMDGLGHFIAVYPEMVEGNPYGAPTVVRWLLHRPDYFGPAVSYSEGEHVYAWSKLIQPPGADWLWVPTVERDLFNTRYQYSREGYCYYEGKGTGECIGAIDLSHENVPTREELAGILKRSLFMYSFDPYTLLYWEAGLCGCPSVLIPTHEFTREQFKASEYGLAGIAWGYGEMGRALDTVGEREAVYEAVVEKVYNEVLLAFIEETQYG